LVEMLRERVPAADVSFVRRDEDPRDYRVNFEKVKETLGFRPSRRVEDGIDEVLALLQAGVVTDPYAAIYRN
ncbi:MAG: NAD-dependent epimerase/dehydratase family protein, partial [Gaiellaceae bacterium]